MDTLDHYSFALADTILAGEHRPLNQLETEFSEDLESLQACRRTSTLVFHVMWA